MEYTLSRDACQAVSMPTSPSAELVFEAATSPQPDQILAAADPESEAF